MPSPAVSAKERLVLAAERLFARHGIDGVSLRQIGTEAAHANTSAVQYHFGSKDELVQAIFVYRLGHLAARRQELVDQHRRDDLRAWLECHVRAIMEQAELPGSHYMRFLAELQRPASQVPLTPPQLRSQVESFHERLQMLLPHLDEPLRSDRITNAEMIMIVAAATHESQCERGTATLSTDVVIANLVDGMVGFLKAATSSATKAAVLRD